MCDESSLTTVIAKVGQERSAGAEGYRDRPPLSRPQLSARVGSELGVSGWFCIDQGAINAFADVTRDWQPIHIDEEAARSGPFGMTIAHGFLTLSLLSAMALDVLPTLEGQRASVNYGLNNLRFVTPVRSGDRVRGRFTLKNVSERNTRSHLLTIGVVVEIERQPKPALVAEWLTLINS